MTFVMDYGKSILCRLRPHFPGPFSLSRSRQTGYHAPVSEPSPNQAVRFSSVEELDAANQALGWRIEYRQTRRGAFNAEFAALAQGETSIVSEQFDNRLHIHAEPPPGHIGIVLPDAPRGAASACGKALDPGELVLFPMGAELEFATEGKIRDDAIFLPQQRFTELVEDIAPDADIGSLASATIVREDRRGLAYFQMTIAGVRQFGQMDGELKSNLLAAIIRWLERASNGGGGEALTNGAAHRVARRAEDYIEAHLHGTIRLDELCRSVGVSLRTLQRCFASHFQLSPLDYIKARRLNAARRALHDGDPSTNLVKQAALGNGFTHLGRFSIDYRAHFGESPSETLAASPSS